MPRDARKTTATGPLFAALITFVVIGVVSVIQTGTNERAQQEQLQERFHRLSDTVSANLSERLAQYQYGLSAGRGVLLARGENGIDLPTFRNYMETLDLKREFPGSRGFGFIRRVSRDQEVDYLARIRATGRPGFGLRELNSHVNERMVIEIIEPVELNREAVGLDIASEKNRRSAAMRAMLDGSATLTDPITLVQASGQTHQGLLFLLPVYRSGMPLETPEQRRDAAFGFSYTPLVVSEVLDHPDFSSDEFAITVEDTDVFGDRVLMFSNASDDNTGLRRAIPLELYGQQWLLVVSAKQAFIDAYSLDDPVRSGIEIAIVGALFAMLVYAYIANKQRENRAFMDRSRMAAIVESSTDAIVAVDLDGYVTSWNEAAMRIFGYPQEQAIGYRLAELIYPESDHDHLEDQEILTQVRDGVPITQREAVRRRSNGHEIEVELSVAPIAESDGVVIGAAHTIRDISTAVRNAKMFKLAIEASSTALLMVDERGHVAMFNSSALQLLGYGEEELIDLPISKLVPMPSRENHGALMEAFMRDPSAKRMSAGRDLSALRKDGGLVPVEINLNPVDTPEGHMVLTSIHDISHRVELERRVTDTIDQTRLALTAGGIGVWGVDLKTGAVTWDEQTFRLFGMEPGDTNAAPDLEEWLLRVHPDDRDQLRKRIRAFADGETEFKVDFRTQEESRTEERWFRACALKELDDHQLPVRAVGITISISDLKRAESNVREMNMRLSELIEHRTTEMRNALVQSETTRRAKTDFMRNLGYEIRTPMNAIMGICYLLEKRDLGDDVRAMIKKIDAAGKLMLRTVSNTLDLARIESGSLDINRSEFTLTTVLAELTDYARVLIDESPVEFVINTLPEGCPTELSGDAELLQTIIANLLANAARHTRAGEIVLGIETVAARGGAGRSRLRFTVLDTGYAIEPEQREQASGTASGIGLTLSRLLVEMMGGTMGSSSEPGKGNKYWFELEFDRPGTGATLPAAATPPSPVNSTRERLPLAGVHILVVEDDEVNMEIQRSILEHNGASVTCIDNGAAVISALHAHPEHIDVILMDIQLPDIDGIEVASSIRADVGLSHIPVIGVTATGAAELRERAVEAGMSGIMDEPLNVEQLINEIKRCINMT